MAALLRKLAKAAPIAFRGGSKSNFADPRFPFGAIAAVAGCVSYYYCHSSANLVYLEQISEDSGKKVALNPDKWIEFKLQDRAPVSHNSHLFRRNIGQGGQLHIYGCIGILVCENVVTTLWSLMNLITIPCKEKKILPCPFS